MTVPRVHPPLEGEGRERSERDSGHAAEIAETTRMTRMRHGQVGIAEPYGMERPADSGLIPVNLITLSHLSVSAATNCLNSTCERGKAVDPNSENRVLKRGSARPALISL